MPYVKIRYLWREKNMKKRYLLIAISLVLSCCLCVSAGILSYYGRISASANVSQSVLLNGNDYTVVVENEMNIPAGCTKIYKYKLKNTACVEAPIEISTTNINGYGKGTEGVYVSYFLMNGIRTLTLENKNPLDWTIIEDDIYAEVTYNPCCPTFTGTVEVYGLDEQTEYGLIYYADQQDRFENWGGNPIKEIITFTGNGIYDFDINLASCLPMEGDWNICAEADYTQSPDFYEHGKGAKLWIVPTTDYDVEDMTAWNPTTYLFETDLIGYFDCDINPIPSYVYPYFDYEDAFSSIEEYTLQPQEECCLFVKYNFDVAIIPGQYDILTTIAPILPQP